MDKPTSFLSLPRELRDQIYETTIHNFEGSTISRIGEFAETHNGVWCPKRESLPGYYRPLKHYHRATAAKPVQYGETLLPNLEWRHETRVVRVPALFHVSSTVSREARAVYFRKHIMLEARVSDDFLERMDAWMGALRAEDMACIQRVHVDRRISIDFSGDEKDPVLQRLRKAQEFEIDFVTPIYRVEIQGLGAEARLMVLCAVKLPDWVREIIATAVREWHAGKAMAKPSFTGGDVLGACRALIVASMELKNKNWTWQVREVVSIVDSVWDFDVDSKARLSGYGTAVQVKDRYEHVIVALALDQRSEEAKDKQILSDEIVSELEGLSL